MLGRQIVSFSIQLNSKLFAPLVVPHTQTHGANCPVSKSGRCPGSGDAKQGGTKAVPIKVGPIVNVSSSGDDGTPGSGQKRAIRPGKVRLGFIPEEWFGFLKPMTGVTGPYFLMIGLANYLVSKEIFVMEHEYYMGISQFIMVYYAVTKFGPQLAVYLDKEVDDFTKDLEKTRIDELNFHQNVIKESETAIWRAMGLKDLMQAKKENIAVQLEAIYRERAMLVYQRVRGRLDYHVRKQRTVNRVKQKWMVQWILNNVEKSITADFKKQAMESALRQLTALAEQMPHK
ncbi:unnamed protein product [Spodoptera littoralis]|uniref:ATP synthase subunit b n=1 Tax=Spodoptera littoralis TaxID=7109 RepID=A0A9P0IIV9_SPOLI|nr:unnamed protein product [Spodoptera littoralis]CAH1647705.1 unnamed protein product [Spodoptera littoralis]